MRRIGAIAVALFGVLLLSGVASGELVLTSPQLQPGGRLGTAQVFFGFGCTGENTSPALHWKGAPKGTKSFVITKQPPLI